MALVIKDFGTATWYRGQTAQAELRAYAARTTSRRSSISTTNPGRRVASLYRAADVLVVPYRGEGFCLPALEAMACGLPVIHTATGPTAEFVPAGAGWALDAHEVPVPSHFSVPELTGQAMVQQVEITSLVSALSAAASDPQDRKARAQCALAGAGRYTWTEVARRARQSLERLTAERLPLARSARPEAVGRRPDTALVLYAPDWCDEARWTRTLAMWAEAFTEQDPVTLALHAGEQDAKELAARILERLESAGRATESLPDVMLCEHLIHLEDLVGAADGVLIDECDRGRPELMRRALDLVAADRDGIRELRARIEAGDNRIDWRAA